MNAQPTLKVRHVMRANIQLVGIFLAGALVLFYLLGFVASSPGSGRWHESPTYELLRSLNHNGIPVGGIIGAIIPLWLAWHYGRLITNTIAV